MRIDRPGGVELYLEHVVMPQSVACGRHEALAAQQKVKTALIARRFGPGARLLHTPEGAPRIEGAELMPRGATGTGSSHASRGAS